MTRRFRQHRIGAAFLVLQQHLRDAGQRAEVAVNPERRMRIEPVRIHRAGVGLNGEVFLREPESVGEKPVCVASIAQTGS